MDEEESRQRPTLPPGYPGSTIGAGGLNGRVRNGNGCDPSAMVTGMKLVKGADQPNETLGKRAARRSDRRFKHYKRHGQASRPISTRKLRALLPLDIGPINLVVYKGSSGRLRCGGLQLCDGFTRGSFTR